MRILSDTARVCSEKLPTSTIQGQGAWPQQATCRPGTPGLNRIPVEAFQSMDGPQQLERSGDQADLPGSWCRGAPASGDLHSRAEFTLISRDEHRSERGGLRERGALGTRSLVARRLPESRESDGDSFLDTARPTRHLCQP